ncbi:energy transducer TonB [Flavobacterium chilense]|uniref:Outer membrane transport energization protein TonB n=1 Tax=Flavobacterium chilense TaxID=946677 RepID=A0A1M7GGX5_9FLAO|nr:energy transducer TonB [Flavobacterium chilense]SHM15520.1 outer membrane transport energization protein TonB [Flavobacterium chilense]
MSKSSIYETSWTNLVFENKNKEYGAYQLRQENSKTTITALFVGLLLLATLGSVSMLINKLKSDSVIETDPVLSVPLTPVDLTPIPVQPEQPAPVIPQQQAAAATPATDLSQLSHPVVVTTEQAVDNIATNAQNTTVIENATPGNGIGENPIPGNGTTNTVVTEVTDPGTTVLPVNALDKLPEFPGGMAKFYTYVGNNFNRPELDAEKTLRVYVSFVIERDGSITDIMVKNDPGYGIGKEAIRVLKSLKTKWIPGVLNGKAVRTAYNLPITIKTEAE